MAHVLIVGNDGRARLAHLSQHGDFCDVEDTATEDHKLSWKIIGLATMAVVSGAGWFLVVEVARHFFN